MAAPPATAAARAGLAGLAVPAAPGLVVPAGAGLVVPAGPAPGLRAAVVHAIVQADGAGHFWHTGYPLKLREHGGSEWSELFKTNGIPFWG